MNKEKIKEFLLLDWKKNVVFLAIAVIFIFVGVLIAAFNSMGSFYAGFPFPFLSFPGAHMQQDISKGMTNNDYSRISFHPLFFILDILIYYLIACFIIAYALNDNLSLKEKQKKAIYLTLLLFVLCLILFFMELMPIELGYVFYFLLVFVFFISFNILILIDNYIKKKNISKFFDYATALVVAISIIIIGIYFFYWTLY